MVAGELDRVRATLEAAPGIKIVTDKIRTLYSSDYYKFRTYYVTLVVVPELPIYEVAKMDQQARPLLPEGLFDLKYVAPHRTTSYSYGQVQEQRRS